MGYANIELDTIKTYVNKYIELDTSITRAYKAGQISWDGVYKSMIFDMGVNGVRASAGQESYNIYRNDTGSELADGVPLAFAGGLIGILPKVKIASNDQVNDVLGFAGLNTSVTPDGEIGFATIKGRVQGINTLGLSQTFVYLGTGGNLLQSRPNFPANRLIVGAVEVVSETLGIINVLPFTLPRFDVSKSYAFTSTGVNAGEYWKAGFYDWADNEAVLNQGNLSVNFGTADQTYAAHAGIVAAAAGTVDTGQVGLRVTGIRDDESGIQVAAQTDIVTEDITTLTTDQYKETTEKFSGQIVFELYVVSGSPTNYALSFNYGYSKYDDFQNRDFTVTEFEVIWQGNANDTIFDIALMHHSAIGWTYAASGFTPGNDDICRKSVDQALAGNVVNGSDGAYKRTGLDFFIEGEAEEGIIIQIISGANGTIQIMDIHVGGVSEELIK